MIDLLLTALFQTAAGEPQTVTQAAVEETEATPLPGVQVPNPEEQQVEARNVRICRRVLVTGSRVRRETVCSSQAERANAREAFRAYQDFGASHRGYDGEGN